MVFQNFSLLVFLLFCNNLRVSSPHSQAQVQRPKPNLTRPLNSNKPNTCYLEEVLLNLRSKGRYHSRKEWEQYMVKNKTEVHLQVFLLKKIIVIQLQLSAFSPHPSTPPQPNPPPSPTSTLPLVGIPEPGVTSEHHHLGQTDSGFISRRCESLPFIFSFILLVTKVLINSMLRSCDVNTSNVIIRNNNIGSRETKERKLGRDDPSLWCW